MPGREALERHRDLHVEPEKKRATSKFTFAKLGENEEDLAEREVWYAKMRGLVPVLRRRSRFARAREVQSER